MTRIALVALALLTACGSNPETWDEQCAPCGGGEVGAYVDGVTVCYGCPVDGFVGPGTVCSTGREVEIPSRP